MCIETVNSLRMEKGGKGKNRTIRNKASDIGCERPVIGKGHFHGLMRKEECVETVAGAAAETDGWSLVCGLTAQRKGMVITMKRMKKIVCLVLALTLVAMLAACGKTPADDSKGDAPSHGRLHLRYGGGVFHEPCALA